jgi:hypothetical protein
MSQNICHGGHRVQADMRGVLMACRLCVFVELRLTVPSRTRLSALLFARTRTATDSCSYTYLCLWVGLMTYMIWC